jgi:PPOX class probable F420-dependent enzyme
MAELSEAQRAFVRDNAYPGVLTTLRADGSPHTTIVWIDLDGDDVVFNTAVGRAKERYVKSDPRVSVLVADPSDPYHWVSVSGRAELDTTGAREMIDRLSRKYQGKDYPPEWLGPGEQRITGRVRVDKVDSSGFDS